MADAPRETGTLARQIFLRTMSPGRSLANISSRMAELMEDMFLPAGTVIYRQGQAPERIYFIVEGTVALRADGLDDWTFKEKSIIGVIDANLDRPRSRNAITLTDVHLLSVRVEDYFETMEDNFEQQRMIIYNITSGMRSIIADLSPDGGFVDPPAAAVERKELRRLSPVERMIALRGVAAFERASIQALSALAEVVEELLLPEGDTELRPGGKHGALLVVASGIVEMIRTTPNIRAKFGAGSVIGGISTLDEEHPDTKLVVIVPAIVLRLGEEDLFDVVEDHFDLARSILAHGALERERLTPMKVRRSKPM